MEQTFRYTLGGCQPLRERAARIGIVGDLVLGENAEEALAAAKHPVWGTLELWVRELDLFVATFDGTFPGSDLKPWEPRVFAGTHCLDSVPAGKKTLFNLANNHVFDGGIQGFMALRWALDSRNIQYVGAGENRDVAERPWTGTVRGQPIKIFAATHHGCHPRPTLADGAQVAQLENQTWWDKVAASIDGKTVVLVLLHGGVQGSHYPSPKAIEISRRLVEIGVHAVVWSHAHVVQGIVSTSKGFVAYGLGNAMHLPLQDRPERPHPNLAYDWSMCLEFTPDPAGIQAAEYFFIQRHALALEPKDLSPAHVDAFRASCRQPLKKYYDFWWKWYRLKEDVWKRTLGYFRRGPFLRQLVNLRPVHLSRLFLNMANARTDSTDV